MEQLWFTRLLNSFLAKPVTALLLFLHRPVANPAAPISNSVAMETLVALLLALFGSWIGGRLSEDEPGAWQHVMEWFWTALGDHTEDVIDHAGRRFLPFLMTLTLFILIGNLFGLFRPFLESPTATVTVPIGLAVAAFFYYNYHGIKQQGVGHYLAHFAGPVPALAPLMFPIEIISHLARMLSLSVRLWANMYAGDMITTVFTALLPIAGVAFMGLHVFVAVLQTYIFVVLTMAYLTGATVQEHAADL